MMLQPHESHASRSEDLHRHVLRSHLAYLNQEETPAKLEQRHNLESLISEFLSIVSHSVKFTFLDISDIFNTSIENNPNFSAYKAGSAFEALEKYATNLISQPWRKEYKTIKLYSGFYKHSVESQLIGSSATFHLLGYQYINEGELYLDGPIDPDKVARVALDCLIACVECQIMIQICERVKAYKCSWDEIHNIRQDYICSIDEAVRILHQLKRNIPEEKHDHWLRSQENGFLKENILSKSDLAQDYTKKISPLDVSTSWSSNMSSISSYNTHPSIHLSASSGAHSKSNKENVSTHSKISSWHEDLLSPLENYDINFMTRAHEHNYPSHIDDHLEANYTFSNKSNKSGLIPDIDSGTWNHSWDFMHSPVETPCQNRYVDCDQDFCKINSVPIMNEAHESHRMYPAHPPMIPYLPQNFETSLRRCSCHMCYEQHMPTISKKPSYSQASSNGHAFSNNPLFNRDAIPTNSPIDITSSFSKLSLDDDITNSKTKTFPSNSMPETSTQYIDSSMDNLRSRNKSHSNINKRESYYDNVPSLYDQDLTSLNYVGHSLDSKCNFQLNGTFTSDVPSKKFSNKKTMVDESSNSLPIKSNNLQKKSLNSSILTTTEHLPSTSHSDSKSIKSYLPISKDSKGVKRWSCTTCTFLNIGDKSICDMCGRSKNPGPEVTPLVSGGRECPQCTLVNKKESQDCSACGGSLKDSPTYI